MLVASDDTAPDRTPHERQPSTPDWQYCVRQAAEQLHDLYRDNERFAHAWTLVLGGAVALHPDGTATVQSGTHTYHINGDCTCQDAQHRTKYCKHYLAVEIAKLATTLLTSGQQHPPETGALYGHPARTGAPRPPSASSHWHVQEAPAACTLKFQVEGVDVLYTMRDTSDDALFARIKRILPRVQAKAKEAQDSMPQCPIHNVPLQRYSKNGQVWLSHRTADGQWCRGEQP